MNPLWGSGTTTADLRWVCFFILPHTRIKLAKRFSDTEIWSEDWFLEMPNEYKLFWFYMLSQCDHAGLFKVNLRSFRGLLEVNLTTTDALKYFNNGKDRIRVITDSLWFIEDFFVFQYGTVLNLNNRMHESVANCLQKQKIELTSIRGLTDLKDRVKDKDKDKEIQKGVKGENKNGKMLGVRIDEEKNLVFFEDDTFRELDKDELRLLKEGTLKAHYLRKN